MRDNTPSYLYNCKGASEKEQEQRKIKNRTRELRESGRK